MFSIYTALRISDLLTLRWGDVYDYKLKKPKETFTITEKKTGKSKIIAINKNVAVVLKKTAATSQPHEFLFANENTRKAISRTQAYRIIRTAGENLNFPMRISCHSLRKTFGYHSWENGVSPVVMMEIYNHTSYAVTKRYLGVSQDDQNAVYVSLSFR